MTVPAEIDVRGLCFRYPDGPAALSDITFRIAPGETVAVLGPSGAGKSTLLLHINGLLPSRLPAGDLDEAAVTVGDLPLTPENLGSVREKVGLLFQNPDDQLFCPTVARDVAFGPLNLGLSAADVTVRVEQALAEVGLESFADRDTMRLSMGERKRACPAGLLACRPDCLVLDEPFSNLDPRARRHVADIVSRFSGTTLLATHDLDLVGDLCDRVLVLDSGVLCADGATDTILSDQSLMEKHGLFVSPCRKPGTNNGDKSSASSPNVTYNSHSDPTDRLPIPDQILLDEPAVPLASPPDGAPA
ncbi:MAG: ABC transporter ATP-binding protein [Planctomycetaceae bacterium]